MKKSLIVLVNGLLLVTAFLAGSLWGRNHAAQAEGEAPEVVSAFGHNLNLYYPAQKKLYVYTELGGNCVYAYTLGEPGGLITRENCK